MRPVIFSLVRHQKTGNGWCRGGEKVTYIPSPVHDIIEGM